MSGVTVRASIGAPCSQRPTEGSTRGDAPSQGARALALAHYVDQALEEGRYRSASEVAAALGITRQRLSQVMALVLLPPQVQEAVLSGEISPSPRELRTGAQFMTTTTADTRPIDGGGTDD